MGFLKQKKKWKKTSQGWEVIKAGPGSKKAGVTIENFSSPPSFKQYQSY